MTTRRHQEGAGPLMTDIVDELRGFAAGSESARASLMRDAAALIPVRRSIYAAPTWATSIEGEHDSLSTVSIEVAYDDQLRRYVATSVSVQRAGTGSEVTGAVLRDVKVGERVQQGALRNMWLPRSERLKGPMKTIDGQRCYDAATVLSSHAPMQGRASDEWAREAAYIYDIATVAYMPPLQTISKVLETSQSTAKRLVARAREEQGR